MRRTNCVRGSTIDIKDLRADKDRDGDEADGGGSEPAGVG